MHKIIITLIILISTLSYAQNQNEPIIIPFDLTPNGHILITAKVNNVEGKFIFDTGAGMNLLLKKFADKIPNLEKTHHFHTGHRATGEAIMTDIWNAKLLEIGEFKFEKDLYSVYDLDIPIDGLISLTPFIETPITIDFKNKQLIVESKKSLNNRIKESDFEMPIKVHYDKEITIGIAADIKLNDTLSLLVNLDSGAGFGVYRFNSRYMENLNIDTLKVKTEIRKSMFNPEHSNTFYFTKVDKLSNAEDTSEIKNFNAQFITGLIHEGIMGIDWIGEIITIDIMNMRLIVKK
ncbi:retropepsin-like aspartic protease [uncultured Formosa sp.]|uniref:aspartyl protease family protein n=1 Tax=uncultured Formosa sp. TaxID=255435 RepID=UPI002607EDBC|nr:retropepsin-like aspartic protease [uncultured Formosa sp.]